MCHWYFWWNTILIKIFDEIGSRFLHVKDGAVGFYMLNIVYKLESIYDQNEGKDEFKTN